MTVEQESRRTGSPADWASAPIVAGVDGSGAALDAVRWAARDAARLGVPLRLVHACHHGDRTADAFGLTAPDIGAELRARGAGHLRAAATVARVAEPGLRIESRLCEGDPRVVLRHEAQDAATVVLGHDGPGAFGGLAFGSCALALAVHGRCAVVVVRGRVTDQGDVVAGVDRGPESIAAARYAMQVAALFGTGVTALRTWTSTVGDSAVRHEAARRELIEQMAPLAAEFPTVPVEYVVLRGRPGRTLLEFGEHARLLVVGTHGSGAVAGLIFGSTSQSLALRAPCPVAVVPVELPARLVERALHRKETTS